jgi:hypothetical protein
MVRLALQSDPREHAFESGILVEPMTGSSVGTAKVANDVLIGDL